MKILQILVEVSSLIEKIQNDKKIGIEEHNLASYVDIAVGSIINNLLFGYRFDGVSEKVSSHLGP